MPEDARDGADKRQKRYAQFINATPSTDFSELANESSSKNKDVPLNAAMGRACQGLVNVLGDEALSDKNLRANLIGAAGEYIIIRGDRARKEAAKIKLESDADLIPRSARFKLELEAPNEVQEGGDFKTLSEELDSILEQCGKDCKEKIIKCIGLTIQYQTATLHKSFVKSLPNFIEGLLIEREIQGYHKHRVFVDLLATYPESVLSGNIVKMSGEQLKLLYKSIHKLDNLPSQSTANIYSANVDQTSGSTRNSRGEHLLTQGGEIVDATDGGLEDDDTGDTAMGGNSVQAGNSAQEYLNDKGVSNNERNSFLLILKGALTAAFTQPWNTWETTEKKIEKGKAQRRLVNEKDKSELADEVLQILTDDGKVDSDALATLVDRRIDNKTKGLRAENLRLKAKIKQLENSSSKNETRGHGGAAGKKKMPTRNGRNNDQRKNGGGKGGQGGQSNASKGGKKSNGGNQSSTKSRKSNNSSSTKRNKSTNRSTQK